MINRDPFTHRYKFFEDDRTIRDTKFHRDIVAQCKRGGVPYYRLVGKDDHAVHVPITEVWGEDALEDVTVDTDFDPCDFGDRYDFNFGEGTVTRLKAKGPNSGKPMTLLSPKGWKHYLLTRNDGVRVRVTPSEIALFKDRDLWEVSAPEGTKTFPIFDRYSFGPDGSVWLLWRKGGDPLIRPLRLSPTVGKKSDPHFYDLISKTGKHHKITVQSVMDLFSIKGVGVNLREP